MGKQKGKGKSNPETKGSPPRKQGFSFISTVFLCLVAAVLVQVRNGFVESDEYWRKFRSFENVFGECDESCLKRLYKDMETVATKNEYWINSTEGPDDESGLEKMARKIYSFHCGSLPGCGGEWWIMIRKNEHVPRNSPHPFHFDKDERASNEEGIFRSPNFTSVTYLSDGGYPTVAFPVSVEPLGDLHVSPGTGDSLEYAYFGFPKFGRQITFDASLLHGALVMPEYINWESDKRYVLVMSFWLDGYQPANSRSVMSADKRSQLSKEEYPIFPKDLRPKNSVKELSKDVLDEKVNMNKREVLQLDINFFHTSHFSETMRKQNLRIKACLPSPMMLRQSNQSSMILNYGNQCKAVLIEESFKLENNEGQIYSGAGSLIKGGKPVPSASLKLKH